MPAQRTSAPKTFVVLGAVLVVGASASLSSATPSQRARPDATKPKVVTFTSTGAEQTFVVPKHVTSVMITATGASGGDATTSSASDGIGGVGGLASGEVKVKAGETLYVEVGGAGQPGIGGTGAAAFNGGGQGGPDEGGVPGGGGGGASDVRTQPASAGSASLGSRLVVAGGGGGAGGSGPTPEDGGAAGLPGNPVCAGCSGGSNASKSAGGTGGPGSSAAGGGGGLGYGGSGGSAGGEGQAGGGGGGGLYGGGGGGGVANFDENSGGGGGGSSGFGSGVTDKSVESGTTAAASVTVAYTVTPAISLAAHAAKKSLAVKGSLKPSAPGVKMTVSLERKKGSKYATVATKHPLVSTAGKFTTSFAEPKAGKCKIAASFPGYHDLAASKKTTSIKC